MPRSPTRRQGALFAAIEVNSPTRSTTPRREETTKAADTTNGRSTAEEPLVPGNNQEEVNKAEEPQEGNHQGGGERAWEVEGAGEDRGQGQEDPGHDQNPKGGDANTMGPNPKETEKPNSPRETLTTKLQGPESPRGGAPGKEPPGRKLQRGATKGRLPRSRSRHKKAA